MNFHLSFRHNFEETSTLFSNDYSLCVFDYGFLGSLVFFMYPLNKFYFFFQSYSVESSSDNSSDLDLSKDLKPIEDYVKDRQVMIKEMFASVSRDKLRAMLPEILKVYQNFIYHLVILIRFCVSNNFQPIPMNDLQKFCFEELEVMSRKRIIRILQGKSNFLFVTCFITTNESSFEIIWLEIAV